MNKIKWNKWWRHLIVSFIGIFLFSIFIPGCTYLSSASFDVLVRDKKPEAIADETKSLAEIVANLPTPEQIQVMPLAAHPRLLASEARFAEIKEQIKSDRTTREWYEKLRQQGDNFLQEELPTYRLLDGKRLFKQNKAILRRVTTFALLYKLENKPVYLDRVWQELKATADFRDWNPEHFLDTARITYIFAVSYDWLYEDWSEEQKKIIRSAILDKGLKPALSAHRKDKWWTNAKNNWNQVCNGGIGIGALAVIEEYPEVASIILSQALQSISVAMQHYAPDGAWDEGTGYWNFGTRYNILLLASLETALDTDFNLSNIKGFGDTGWFPIYMTGSSGLTFNFSDNEERPVKAPYMFWLSRRFDNKAYADYQRKIASPEPLDLIWYKPDVKKSDREQLPTDKYFRGAEIVSMRSGWKPDEIFVGFKAGDNNSNHGNLDMGTFVVDALGIRWAVELGYDEYNLPGYFDKEKNRWTYYRTRAEGQNTLVINPDRTPDQNPNAKAKITKFRFQPKESYAVADLTSAYYPKVKHIDRTVSLNKKDKQLTIQDRVEAKIPVDLWWFMHTEANIQLGRDRHSAILQHEDKRLWIGFCSSQSNSVFSVMDADPLLTSPDPRNQDQNDGIHKLAIRLNSIEKERLSTVIVPLYEGEAPHQRLSQDRIACNS